MISATHHRNESQLMLNAALRKSFRDRRIALGRGIRVQQFFVDWDLPPDCNGLTCGLNRTHHRITPLEICVPDVHSQVNATGNAVDGTRKHFTDTYGGY